MEENNNQDESFERKRRSTGKRSVTHVEESDRRDAQNSLDRISKKANRTAHRFIHELIYWFYKRPQEFLAVPSSSPLVRAHARGVHGRMVARADHTCR